MTIGISIFLIFVVFGMFIIPSKAQISQISSKYTPTPPLLDGSLDYTYEIYAEKISIWIEPESNHITTYNYLYIMNDMTNLYIFLDLCSDNSTEDTDAISFFLDPIWNPRSLEGDFTVYLFEVSRETYDTTPENLIFGYDYGFSRSLNQLGYSHVQWEIVIPFTTIQEVPTGGIMPKEILPFPRDIGLGFFGYGTLAPEYKYPFSFTSEETWTYAQVHLAMIPLFTYMELLVGSLLVIGGLLFLGNEIFNRFIKKKSTIKWWNIAGDIVGGSLIFFGAVYITLFVVTFL
jgi:hypothetical protein